MNITQLLKRSAVVFFFLLPLPLFAVESPDSLILELPQQSTTINQLLQHLERSAPVSFTVESTLLNRTVRFDRVRLTLREFVEQLSTQLETGYIIAGPDEQGRFRILVASRKPPSSTSPAPRYREVQQPAPVRRARPARQPVRQRPPVQQPATRSEPTKSSSPSKTLTVPTAGSLQTLPTTASGKKEEPRKKP